MVDEVGGAVRLSPNLALRGARVCELLAFERAGMAAVAEGWMPLSIGTVPPPRIGGSTLRQALSVDTSKRRRGGPGRSQWRRTVLAWIGDDTRAVAARIDSSLPRIP